jgi:hypothetical protein
VTVSVYSFPFYKSAYTSISQTHHTVLGIHYFSWFWSKTSNPTYNITPGSGIAMCKTAVKYSCVSHTLKSHLFNYIKGSVGSQLHAVAKIYHNFFPSFLKELYFESHNSKLKGTLLLRVPYQSESQFQLKISSWAVST